MYNSGVSLALGSRWKTLPTFEDEGASYCSSLKGSHFLFICG